MTNTAELNTLIERLRKHGADVLVLWNTTDGRRLHDTIAIRGIAGIGPNAMPPIQAAEAMRAYLHTHLLVERLSPDAWDRPRLRNLENGRIYADISLGDVRHQPVKWNLAGDWHTTSDEGEPDCRLRDDIVFVMVR